MRSSKFLKSLVILTQLGLALPCVAQNKKSSVKNSAEIDITCAVSVGRPSGKFGGAILIGETIDSIQISSKKLPVTLSGSYKLFGSIKQLEPIDLLEQLKNNGSIEHVASKGRAYRVNYSMRLDEIKLGEKGIEFVYGDSKLKLVDQNNQLLIDDFGNRLELDDLNNKKRIYLAYKRGQNKGAYPGPEIKGEEVVFHLGDTGSYVSGSQMVYISMSCHKSY